MGRVALVAAAAWKTLVFKELLNKSFDRLRTNGKELSPFVLSLSKHERNQLNQRFLKGGAALPRLPIMPSLAREMNLARQILQA
jgi:hypothetical protein